MNSAVKLFLFIFTILISKTESYKILCVYPTPSHSHLVIAKLLMKELVDRGHEVTVVSPFPLDKPIRNYRDIYVPMSDQVKEKFQDIMSNGNSRLKLLSQLSNIQGMAIGLSNDTLHNPEFRKITHEETFDLVILGMMMNPFLLGIAAHFKCPVVVFSSIQTSNLLNELVGNPEEVANIPNLMTVLEGDRMTFIDRVIGMLSHGVYMLIDCYMQYKFEEFYNLQFPQPKYPSYSDMKRNVSLVLVNHHFTQGHPRAYVPALIEVGGIQIKDKPTPLPEDIKVWLDGATEGAIFFSLGSNFKSTDLPPEKRTAILKALGSLKQRILWKFEEEFLPGLPENIKISKWVPQDDILAHKNIKLFITHGGMGSIAEAKYHGVPLITIPLFGDQIVNAVIVENEGWSYTLKYADLDEQSLSIAVTEVLTNSKYTETVKRWSHIYRDRPMTAMETAIFWIEYVIRHRGAKHMQSNAVHLNFWQRNSLDVIGFLSVVLLLVANILKWIKKMLCSLCCDHRPQTRNKQE